jgi:signal transduction histidine kinase
VTRPQTARQISKGLFDKRVPLSSRFEKIKRLGATFNTMLDRIQMLLQSMKEINDNIAHDLRSPLARIRGVAEMTLMTEPSTHACRDMAVDTMEESDTLIDMINTMLDLTEAEAGVQQPVKETIDLVPLITDALELFRPLARERGIVLTSQLPPRLLFEGDRKKMQRVMTNIIENAIKYTPENGVVTAVGTREKDGIQVTVQDTGIGISREDLPRIFERFYRCDRSRSNGGVGLGLCLAKAYIESMDGEILVDSRIDQGSTFRLRFGA